MTSQRQRQTTMANAKRVVLAACSCLLVGLVGCADDDETGEPGECYPFTGCTDSRGVDGGSGEVLCTNTCRFADDGECDDGGPGADYDLCEYGSDCIDCGPRY